MVMQQVISRWKTLTLPAAFALALVGCTVPDSEARFGEFEENTAELRLIPDLGPQTGGQQIDFSDRYFMALATTLNPAKPLYFDVNIAVSNDFLIDFEFQPLRTDLEPAGTERADARTPSGDVIIVNEIQLEDDGTFIADLGVVAAPGDANPITGSDIKAQLTLTGAVYGDHWCGTVTGDVIEPLALGLEGSTFGSVIVDDETLPSLVWESKCAVEMTDDADMGAM